MPSLGDLLLDWHRGAQAVAREDWDCALRLFSSDPEPPARMCFNVGCVHLLAGDPEAALRVSRGLKAGRTQGRSQGPHSWGGCSLALEDLTVRWSRSGAIKTQLQG